MTPAPFLAAYKTPSMTAVIGKVAHLRWSIELVQAPHFDKLRGRLYSDLEEHTPGGHMGAMTALLTSVQMSRVTKFKAKRDAPINPLDFKSKPSSTTQIREAGPVDTGPAVH